MTALAPVPVAGLLPEPAASTGPLPEHEMAEALRGRAAVALAAGDYMAAGRVARGVVRHDDRRFVVVQHGLMTPWAPPLPRGAVLLAWSSRDAEFWRNGDPTIATEVVGSALLADAARSGPGRDPVPSSPGQPVVFLGQLHGTELPRSLTRGTVGALHRQGPLGYRAHPGETDVLSRWQHRRWAAQGIRLLPPDPLASVTGSVVSHFSTGILEAAALGLPAYAWCAQPPPWLREVWSRYRMSVWGRDRTPTRVSAPDVDPAESVADAVERLLA